MVRIQKSQPQSQSHQHHNHDAVRAYFHTNHGLGIGTREIVGRKIYIDSYNYALDFATYVPNNPLSEPKCRPPPACMEESSYEHVIGWLVWAGNGKWIKKGQVIPSSYYDM